MPLRKLSRSFSAIRRFSPLRSRSDHDSDSDRTQYILDSSYRKEVTYPIYCMALACVFLCIIGGLELWLGNSIISDPKSHKQHSLDTINEDPSLEPPETDNNWLYKADNVSSNAQLLSVKHGGIYMNTWYHFELIPHCLYILFIMARLPTVEIYYSDISIFPMARMDIIRTAMVNHFPNHNLKLTFLDGSLQSQRYNTLPFIIYLTWNFNGHIREDRSIIRIDTIHWLQYFLSLKQDAPHMLLIAHDLYLTDQSHSSQIVRNRNAIRLCTRLSQYNRFHFVALTQYSFQTLQKHTLPTILSTPLTLFQSSLPIHNLLPSPIASQPQFSRQNPLIILIQGHKNSFHRDELLLSHIFNHPKWISKEHDLSGKIHFVWIGGSRGSSVNKTLLRSYVTRGYLSDYWDVSSAQYQLWGQKCNVLFSMLSGRTNPQYIGEKYTSTILYSLAYNKPLLLFEPVWQLWIDALSFITAADDDIDLNSELNLNPNSDLSVDGLRRFWIPYLDSDDSLIEALEWLLSLTMDEWIGIENIGHKWKQIWLNQNMKHFQMILNSDTTLPNK